MSSLGFLRYIDRRTLKRLIFAVLAAAWCGLIFYLSSQPGDESSRTSGGFINFFCELIVPDFSGFSGFRHRHRPDFTCTDRKYRH